MTGVKESSWLDEKSGTVRIIDQRRLPHELVAAFKSTLQETVDQTVDDALVGT